MSSANKALNYAAIVSLGGFLFGFDATVISGVIGFVSTDFALTDLEIGLVVGAPTLTGILAAVTVGPLADRFGRRPVLKLLALLYAVSAVFSALAPDYISLVVARAIGGYAFGSLGLAPIYIAETSPAGRRGFMVSVNQLNIVVGFSAAYFANYLILLLSQSSLDIVALLQIDSHPWRWMLGLEAMPAFVYLGLLHLVPESPRWLMLQGRKEEASAILATYLSPEKVQRALTKIAKSTARHNPKIRAQLTTLLSPTLRRVLILGLILGVTQQITGINAVYFYAPTIFEQAGMGTNAAFAQAIWVGIINIAVTVIAMAAIDRIGRRPLMIAGLVGIVLSMAVIAFGFSQAAYRLDNANLATLTAQEQTDLAPLVGRTFGSDTSFKLALRDTLGETGLRKHEAALLNQAMTAPAPMILAGILGFVASFALSLGPVMWVLLSEIFPNHLRAVAMAAVGFFNSLASFLVQLLFPLSLTTVGATGTFALYGACALGGLLLLLKLLPETKGRTLEELECTLVRKPHSDAVTPTAPQGDPL